MRIQDTIILEGKSEDPGVYVAVHYSKESRDALTAYAESLKIDNITSPSSEFHTTVIYSTSPLKKGEKITPRKWSVENPLTVKPKGLRIFKSRSGEHCLVLELTSPTLKRRFTTLMKDYPSLSTDFPDYIPHITLSYDVGKDYTIPSKPDFSLIKTLEIVEEYVDELDTNWKDKLKS